MKKVILIRYLLPILSVGVILSLKLFFKLEISPDTSFLLLLIPVIISAWFGGFRAGLFTTLLSILSIRWFFLEPLYSFAGMLGELRLGIFAVEGLLISWLCHIRWKKVYIERSWRESNLRLQLTLQASHVGFWEWDIKTNEVHLSPEWKKQLGYENNEITDQLEEWTDRLHPDDKDKTVSVFRSYQEHPSQTWNLEYRLRHKDGTYRWMLSRGSLVENKRKEPWCICGINVDITEQKESEQLLIVQYTITQILTESKTVNEAAQKTIQKICELLGWKVGALWLVDSKENVLKCVEIWHDPSIKVSEFKEMSFRTKFSSGVGLPGRVWSTGKPVWIPDIVKDSNFPRAPLAFKEGLHAACGFPLNLEDQIIGVIEFFSPEILQPNLALLHMIAGAGNQIGQLIEREQAEEDLRRSQRELTDFVENVAIGLHWIGPDGKILWVNQNELNLLGYTREEYIGHHISEFHVNKPLIDDTLRRLMNKEIVNNYGAELLCKDGSVKNVLISSSVMWGEDGRFIHTRCFTRDISELKKAEEALKESEAKYADLYDNAPDMYAFVDVKTAKILTCNQTLVKSLGYTKEEMIGRPVFDLYHPDSIENAKKAFQNHVEMGEVRDVELQFMRKDGSKIDVSLNRTSVKDKFGNILYSRSSWRDITERKKIERQIEEYTNYKQADAKLRQEDAKIRQEDAKIRQADAKIKGEFTAMVSHELRTPLQVIKGGVDLVLNETLGPIDDEQREQLDAVKRNVDRLTRLIHDVLDYQKLDSGAMEFQMRPLNMNELIRDTAELFSPLAKEKGLELVCDLKSDLSNVVCDKDKIAQVLVNFIDNAVKFTNQGSVSVKSETRDDSILVSVCDEGIGIKVEDQLKIFENFAQLPTKSKKEGSGLGLAICKKIVEGHGGVIGVNSEYGKGSTFYFKLPNERRD